MDGATDIQSLWMLVRTDIHGNCYRVAEGLMPDEAQDQLRKITSGWPHHQSYELIEYTPATRAKIIAERKLIL